MQTYADPTIALTLGSQPQVASTTGAVSPQRRRSPDTVSCTCGRTNMMTPSETPGQFLRRFLDTYEAHDLDGLWSFYSQDCRFPVGYRTASPGHRSPMRLRYLLLCQVAGVSPHKTCAAEQL